MEETKGKHALLVNGIVTAIAFAALTVATTAFNAPGGHVRMAIGFAGLAVSITCVLLALLLSLRIVIMEGFTHGHRRNGPESRKV